MPYPNKCPNCGTEQTDVIEVHECSDCGQTFADPDKSPQQPPTDTPSRAPGGPQK